MIDLQQFNVLNRKRLTSLLGLALDGSRLDGVVLRRTNGSVEIQQSFSVTLSLDPLTADPALVGQEIRNHLDAAEVRERVCVVGLPLKWALAAHVELPELPEADIASFLQIEAERGFPCDVETLVTANSFYHGAAPATQGPLESAGKPRRHAMMVGIPRNHIALIEQVLRAARLKPLSFSLGIVALQRPAAENSQGVLALAIGDTHVGLQITSGGGIAALRTLEGAMETQGGKRLIHADHIAREARITLGQLPAELRESVRQVRIFGPRDLAQQVADEMELRLESMGLKIETVARYSPGDFGVKVPADAPVSPALSLAATKLAGETTPMEFLPPKVSAFQKAAARYSSGKLGVAGAVGAVIVLVIGGMLAIQQWQLARLRSQWRTMAEQVHDLEKVQDRIRQFRPWFDESIRGLTILRQLTTAFPEDGVVSAKTVEIRDVSYVTCSGTARDNQSLLKTLDRLRAAGGVSDLKVDQIRGRSPMQFTFDFRWSEGGKGEN